MHVRHTNGGNLTRRVGLDGISLQFSAGAFTRFERRKARDGLDSASKALSNSPVSNKSA